MINTNSFEYIEFGKKYSEHAASDFMILDYSSEDIKSIAGRMRCERFLDIGLRFPNPASDSPFTAVIPNISACFIKPSEQYYLFVQIQRRQEGDWALRNGIKPRLNRPYNHIRFTYIDEKKLPILEQYFIDGANGYFSLLYKNLQKDNFGEDEYALKDYFDGLQMGKEVPYRGLAQRAHDTANHEDIKKLVNILLNSFFRNRYISIQILNPPVKNWKQKLALIEKAQEIIFPAVGLFTFSLDYISERTDINLHFYSDREAKGVKDCIDWSRPNPIDTDYYTEIMNVSSKKYYSENIKNPSFIKQIREYVNAE